MHHKGPHGVEFVYSAHDITKRGRPILFFLSALKIQFNTKHAMLFVFSRGEIHIYPKRAPFFQTFSRFLASRATQQQQ